MYERRAGELGHGPGVRWRWRGRFRQVFFDLAQGDYVSDHPEVRPSSLREDRYDWQTK